MSPEVIERFSRFRSALIAARDIPQPECEELNAQFHKGMLAGLNVAIRGIETELRVMGAHPNTNNEG